MKGLTLSKRLEAIIAFVSDGARVADIGTDHGFVPICLIQRGICPSAIAMDVREGPLEGAGKHIREYGLSSSIETRLSDGFSALYPGEADTAVIAGMGGRLMIRIIMEGWQTVRSLKELVLSPQSEIPLVRRFLLLNRFEIKEEIMIEDEGKYYTILKILTPREQHEKQTFEFPAEDTEKPFTPDEKFGPILLKQMSPVFHAYVERELSVLTRVEAQLSENYNESLSDKLNEIQSGEKELREILRQFNK